MGPDSHVPAHAAQRCSRSSNNHNHCSRAVDIHAPNFMFQSLSMSGQETMSSVP